MVLLPAPQSSQNINRGRSSQDDYRDTRRQLPGVLLHDGGGQRDHAHKAAQLAEVIHRNDDTYTVHFGLFITVNDSDPHGIYYNINNDFVVFNKILSKIRV